MCDILARLGAVDDKQHLDLSPTNIILSKDKITQKERACLIDFEQNFLLSQDAIAHLAYRKAAMYIAPEVSGVSPRPDHTSDAYSVGMILLDMAHTLFTAIDALDPGNKEVDADTLRRGIAPDTWRSDLDSLWEQAPEFASPIEDLVDEIPDRRLFTLGRVNLEHQFVLLASVITQRFKLDDLMTVGPQKSRDGLRGLRPKNLSDASYPDYAVCICRGREAADGI